MQSKISQVLNDSKFQEQTIEYRFVSDLMIALAHMGKKLEVLRVHTDSFGYDLILKVEDKIKYVQIKSRKMHGKAQYWDVHKTLLKDKKNGIVLVVYFSFEDKDANLVYNYLDFSKYGSTLKCSPKFKKDSNRYCRVSAKDLIRVGSIDELAKILFLKQAEIKRLGG